MKFLIAYDRMVFKISIYLGGIGVLIVLIIKFFQLWKAISIGDLAMRLSLWGIGSFLCLIFLGKIADGFINLKRGKGVDHTLEAETPKIEKQGIEEEKR